MVNMPKGDIKTSATAQMFKTHKKCNPSEVKWSHWEWNDACAVVNKNGSSGIRLITCYWKFIVLF